MTRFFSVLFAALLLSAPASAATLYRLDASSKSGNPTSFDITFEDIDGDMLLSKDELVSFGGITYTFIFPTGYDLVGIVPLIAGFADGLGTSWQFAQSFGGASLSTGVNNFTYSLTELGGPALVPLPASGLLLAGAFGALALGRRRRA